MGWFKALASTGKSVLKTVGDGARTVKTVAGNVDKATGGLAGKAYSAVKDYHPVAGKVLGAVEKGVNAAEKFSGLGIKAIELAERGTKIQNIGDASRALSDGKKLRSDFRRKG